MCVNISNTKTNEDTMLQQLSVQVLDIDWVDSYGLPLVNACPWKVICHCMTSFFEWIKNIDYPEY